MSELLLPEEYTRDAILRIAQARTHIYFLTMILYYDAETKNILDALMAAAKRGVHVEVVGDTFSFLERLGEFRPNKGGVRNHMSAVTTLKKRLRRAGVNFTWLGNQAHTFVTSRTHSKWLVVDDTVYSFGGVNMFGGGLKHADYMLRYDNTGLASALIKEQKRIIRADRHGHSYRSHSFSSNIGKLLFDGGLYGESTIYRAACYHAKRASSITYVSQYCPSGKLARLLKQKDCVFYFNPWHTAAFLNTAAIWVGQFLSGIKSDYTRSQYIHAKCIIFEYPDGNKIAISGSHNFSNGGVWFGTKEIALETSDRATIASLETFINKFIA